LGSVRRLIFAAGCFRESRTRAKLRGFEDGRDDEDNGAVRQHRVTSRHPYESQNAEPRVLAFFILDPDFRQDDG
jgi:hypothetical protein